jgi:hypothetical protein
MKIKYYINTYSKHKNTGLVDCTNLFCLQIAHNYLRIINIRPSSPASRGEDNPIPIIFNFDKYVQNLWCVYQRPPFLDSLVTQCLVGC